MKGSSVILTLISPHSCTNVMLDFGDCRVKSSSKTDSLLLFSLTPVTVVSETVVKIFSFATIFLLFDFGFMIFLVAIKHSGGAVFHLLSYVTEHHKLSYGQFFA